MENKRIQQYYVAVLTEKKADALNKFKTKYPAVTSADLQTFLIGYQAAIDKINENMPESSTESPTNDIRESFTNS